MVRQWLENKKANNEYLPQPLVWGPYLAEIKRREGPRLPTVNFCVLMRPLHSDKIDAQKISDQQSMAKIFVFSFCCYLLSVVAAQAPGDGSAFCSLSSNTPLLTYPTNIKILMDSYHYFNLLPPQADAVWVHVDNDKNSMPGITTSVCSKSSCHRCSIAINLNGQCYDQVTHCELSIVTHCELSIVHRKLVRTYSTILHFHNLRALLKLCVAMWRYYSCDVYLMIQFLSLSML